MILRTADRGREHLGAVDRDHKRVRRVVALDTDISFFNATEQAGGQFVLSISREDVTDDGPATGAERQAFDVSVLAELAADRVFGGAGQRLRVADGECADALRRRDIAVEQHWRRLQRRCDIVEPCDQDFPGFS